MLEAEVYPIIKKTHVMHIKSKFYVIYLESFVNVQFSAHKFYKKKCNAVENSARM